MKTFFIIILALGFFYTSNAQEFKYRRFKGYLNEQPSGSGIEFGALKNITTGETILTDEDGYFEISGTVGDTIRFHSLGYNDNIWVIPGIWYSMKEEIELNVHKRFYSLDEVEVVRYYSYAHFKQAFKDLKLPEDENQKVKEMVSNWEFDDAIAWGKADRKAEEGTFGLSFSGGGKDKVVKQREAVKRLEEIQDQSQQFNYYTSPENINYLTGYQGTCLDSFMVFLNSKYSIDYKMPEYDLLAMILRASDDFKLLKGEEVWFQVSDSTFVQ